MTRDSCENSTSNLGLPLSEAELIAKMDSMKDEIKTCPDCGITFNMSHFKMLTPDEKWFIRDSVPFTVKRRYRADGKYAISVESVCRKCRTKRDTRSKYSRGQDSAGRPRKLLKPEHPPGSPVHTFFFRVVPTCSIS